MVQKVKNILDQALALPPNSRAYIAEVLLESLDFEQDFPVSEAWRTEIQERCSEIDHGEVELIPGDEALASLPEPPR
jgi:putative addiction module component (TIGR02574 family)